MRPFGRRSRDPFAEGERLHAEARPQVGSGPAWRHLGSDRSPSPNVGDRMRFDPGSLRSSTVLLFAAGERWPRPCLMPGGSSRVAPGGSGSWGPAATRDPWATA